MIHSNNIYDVASFITSVSTGYDSVHRSVFLLGVDCHSEATIKINNNLGGLCGNNNNHVDYARSNCILCIYIYMYKWILLFKMNLL